MKKSEMRKGTTFYSRSNPMPTAWILTRTDETRYEDYPHPVVKVYTFMSCLLNPKADSGRKTLDNGDVQVVYESELDENMTNDFFASAYYKSLN